MSTNFAPRILNLGSKVSSWLPAMTTLCRCGRDESQALNPRTSSRWPRRLKSPEWICDHHVVTFNSFSCSFLIASSTAMMITPVPIRLLKLSKVGPGQYLYGRPFESSWCCWHGFGFRCCLDMKGEIQAPGSPHWWFYSASVHLR